MALLKDAQKLPAAIAKLNDELKEMKQTIRRLERAGGTEATPHYRAQRYLYLIHPQRDGERLREYIGTDPKKQRTALASIERFKERSRAAATGRAPGSDHTTRRPPSRYHLP